MEHKVKEEVKLTHKNQFDQEKLYSPCYKDYDIFNKVNEDYAPIAPDFFTDGSQKLTFEHLIEKPSCQYYDYLYYLKKCDTLCYNFDETCTKDRVSSDTTEFKTIDLLEDELFVNICKDQKNPKVQYFFIESKFILKPFEYAAFKVKFPLKSTYRNNTLYHLEEDQKDLIDDKYTFNWETGEDLFWKEFLFIKFYPVNQDDQNDLFVCIANLNFKHPVTVEGAIMKLTVVVV